METETSGKGPTSTDLTSPTRSFPSHKEQQSDHEQKLKQVATELEACRVQLIASNEIFENLREQLDKILIDAHTTGTDVRAKLEDQERAIMTCRERAKELVDQYDTLEKLCEGLVSTAESLETS